MVLVKIHYNVSIKLFEMSINCFFLFATLMDSHAIKISNSISLILSLIIYSL